MSITLLLGLKKVDNYCAFWYNINALEEGQSGRGASAKWSGKSRQLKAGDEV